MNKEHMHTYYNFTPYCLMCMHVRVRFCGRATDLQEGKVRPVRVGKAAATRAPLG